MKKALLFFTLLLLSIPFFAQVPLDTIRFEKRKMYYQDNRVRTIKDLRPLILSLNDSEASRNIKAAKHLKTMGYVTVIGIAVIGNIVNDPSASLTFGVVFANGMLYISRDQKRKAVQRFNAVVKRNGF